MKKKILSLLLAAAMLFSAVAMTSCGDNGSVVDAKPKKGALTTKSLTNVYSAQSVSLLGTVFENSEISAVYGLPENKVLVSAYDKETYESKYFITDADFKNTSELKLVSGDGETYDEYIQQLVVDETNGGIWFIKTVNYYDNDTSYDDEVAVMPRTEVAVVAKTQSIGWVDADSDIMVDEIFQYTEPERLSLLVHYDADGNKVAEADVTEMLTITSEDGSSYYGWISRMVVAGGKLIAVVEGSRINVVDMETLEITDKFDLGEDDIYINDLFADKNGNIYYTNYGDNGMEVCLIDFEAKSGKQVDFPINGDNLYDYLISSGKLGYDFIGTNESGLYGFNLTDKDVTELCNYANSDLDMGYSWVIPVFLADGKLLVAYYDYDNDENVLLKLERVDPSQAKEKYVITVGGSNIPGEVRSAFIKFNRTSDEYKIIFKDYSSYNNEENEWQGAEEQLIKDVVNGNGGLDIVILGSYMDIESMTSKGALEDINKYMDSDKDFNRDDYLDNVFNALEDAGKLYMITPSVNFQTFAVKKSVAGDRKNWTMEEFLAMHKSLGEGEQMLSEATRNGVGEMFLNISLDSFIDSKTGKCSFDSQEFKSLLEYLKDLPADYTAYEDEWENNPNYWEDEQMSYGKGTTKVRSNYISNFKVIPEAEAFMGEEVVLIGYPTTDKNSSGAIITSNTLFAITSSSKVPAGAWAAIKYLLDDEFQSSYTGKENANGSMRASYTFPINKAMIEKKKVNDLKPRFWTYTDENGEEVKEYYENTTWIGDTKVELRDATDADVEAIYEVITKATTVYMENTEVIDIINQEAEAYYNGEKSVDEVANIINSRVQLFISVRM